MPFPLVLAPLLDALIGAGKEVIDRTVPDKNAAEAAKRELESKAQSNDFQLALQQILVNQEEAKSTNWFVAGWRPAVGWIGAFSLAYAAIIDPLIRFFAKVVFHYTGDFPILDSTITMQILFGILGLGAYRTAEKIKGGEGNR